MANETVEEIQVIKVTKREGYIPVSLRCVPLEGLQGLECYIDSQGNFALYCNSETEFTNDDKNRLLHEGVEYLYIDKKKAVNYYRVVQDVLKKIVVNISVPQTVRAQFLYDTASVLAENFFENATAGILSLSELYQQVRKVADAIVEFYVVEEHAFKYILDLMDHDYSVGCHSANVCFYGVAIVSRLKMPKEDWMDMAVGALFHDLGKSRLPRELVYHEKGLTEEQVKAMQAHVAHSGEILKETENASPEVVRLVLEHHETMDGKGYPSGLKAKQLSELGMVVSVANVYDSMIASHAHQQEAEPIENVMGYLTDYSYSKYYFPAVQSLIESICLNSVSTTLAKRLQEVADTEWEEKFDTPRRHKRHYMRRSVVVREVSRENSKVKLSKVEKFMMNNISRSGFAFLSGRPYPKDSNICLTLPELNGPGKDWNALARVVWCEKNISQWYVVGCQFYQIYDKSIIDLIRTKSPAKKRK